MLFIHTCTHLYFTTTSFYLTSSPCLYLSLITFVSFASGDEIIEWNGRALRNKHADEVYQIIDESRLDAQVELVVSRPLPANAAESNAIRKGGDQQQQGVSLHNQCLASTIASSAVVSSGGRYYTRKGTQHKLKKESKS